MTVDVYHRSLEVIRHDPANAFRSRPEVAWSERRGEYKHAATVYVNTADLPEALEITFRAMQHEGESGAERVDLHHEDPRSCSVGDVLVIGGQAYEVQPVGFERI